jgi:hypothetical protein
MQKRHFELIAEILSKSEKWASNEAEVAFLQHIVCNFADELAKTNPLFNRNRFVKACGQETLSLTNELSN